MGAAVLLSRLLGLVREQAFAILFGAGNATDAFNVAFRIPNMMRNLFAEGAMSASLVPTFARVRAEQGEARAWRVAGRVFRVLTVSAGVLALLGILFSRQLVGLYAGAFHGVPGKFELTVRMTRIISPYFPLIALGAAFMGVLNACGWYFLPALSSALFNLVSIATGVSLVVLIRRYGTGWPIHPIEGMAIGVLAGGVAQVLFQLPPLYRAGYGWRERLPGEPSPWRDPALRRILFLMLPATAGLAATQINVMVNTFLATSQGLGAVSWLNYAFRLMQFPIGIFGATLASVTLTEVSDQWARRDLGAVEETLSRSLRYIFAIHLPASAGLAFLGFPIAQLIFQYGRFSEGDARATAWALAAYAVGLTAYSVIKVLVPACYAFGDARAPVLSSMVSVVFSTALSLLLIRPVGFAGLALGTSAGALLNSLILLYAVRERMARAGGRFHLYDLTRSLAANLTVAALMGLAVFQSYRWLESTIPDSLLQLHTRKWLLPVFRMGKVGTLVTEGVILAVLLARSIGLRETAEVFDLFLAKLKKKLSPPGK